MPLAEFIVDLSRWDGWFHLQADYFDVPRGPLGVLAFLLFVPLFWIAPQRAIRPLIIVSSLVLWWVTLGPAFVAFVVALIALYFVGTHAARIGLADDADASRARILWTAVLFHVPYVWLLIDPSPWFLPSMGDHFINETNYLHWCGLGYLHLKAMHVVIDLLQRRIRSVPFVDYAAFMLFPPTFKMGPIYRYDHFVAQIPTCKNNVDIKTGVFRIAVGFVRLGVMMFLISKNIDWPRMYDAPETMKLYKLWLSQILKPFELYFWIAGYCDIAIGIGRLIGFRVPEEFTGPWFTLNIAEFWKRWHITLGRWLYDYPFRALVSVRAPRWACFVLTFLYIGLWHGLNWSHVIWGLAQGVGLAVHHQWHRWWSGVKKRNSAAVQTMRRLRLCDSRLSRSFAWLLNVSYQVVTIGIPLDLEHHGARIIPAMFGW